MASQLLLGRSLRSASYSWTDISAGNELLLTPDYPDTIRKGTATASGGTAFVSAILNSAGVSADLAHEDVHIRDRITMTIGGLPVTKNILALTGSDTLTTDSVYATGGSGAAMWLRDNQAGRTPRYMVLGYELHSVAALKYTFQDEQSVEVGAPVWLGTNGHMESRLWFPVAARERLRLVASGAGAGSITLNFRVQSYVPSDGPGA